MANTSLPTGLTTGNTSHIPDHNTLHEEVNELSRSTGLRDITSLLANGWTATGVRIERIRDHVYFYWRGLDGSASTSRGLIEFGTQSGAISNRFSSMDGSFLTPIYKDDSGGDYTFRVILANIQVPGTSEQRDLGGYWKMVVWRAPSDAWPTFLPGTAV